MAVVLTAVLMLRYHTKVGSMREKRCYRLEPRWGPVTTVAILFTVRTIVILFNSDKS